MPEQPSFVPHSPAQGRLVPRARRVVIAALTGLAGLAGLIVARTPAIASDIVVDIGRGPVTVTVPSGYEPGTPLPLVLVLHGYGGNGASMRSWWQMHLRAEEYGFFVAHPEGTIDSGGSRFWNATDACCNFYGSSVDDSQYLLDFIDEIRSQLDVDPDRVYVCGHSNGGFMSHRMACDHPGTIAAIGSMAGAVWNDPLACDPDSPVHVLQIHGTSDSVIRYEGGSIGGGVYPGAVESTEYWAGVGGCLIVPDTSAPPLDLVNSLPGAETAIARYEEGCDLTGSGELWTIHGGSHSPNFNSNYSRELAEYFLAHSKPTPASTGGDVAVSNVGVLTCTPSPFSSSTSVRLQLEQPASTSIQVVSAGGRLVHVLATGEVLPAGTHEFPWDGRSRSGRDLAAGVYFVRAVVDGVARQTRVVHLER